MTRLIRVGDTGPAVRDVQHRLAHALGTPLPADGVFGPQTLDAVRRFQRDRGLAADGIVGPETWRSLVEAAHSLGDRLLWRSATMMRGDDVRELQSRLNQLGFDSGPEDGLFGPLTQAAVEEFQRNVGLEVDGVAGDRTVEALRRLRRDHQSSGVGIRVREREGLRRLGNRGLAGARIVVDPSHGPDDPGHVGPSGVTEAEVSWGIASRLAGRLGAHGATTLLSRGPRTNPSASQRARLANEQGADLVVSIGVNALDAPQACGASSYYFGAPHFVSESGLLLAEHIQSAVVAAGWRPDCRVHPMTWAILRETRMPAVAVEPGFITSPTDEARLADPLGQESVASALTEGIARFLGDGAASLHARTTAASSV